MNEFFRKLKKKKTISVKNTGDAVAIGPGSSAITGVQMSTNSDFVKINGKTYRKGDKLPKGVDIRWL